ncbi:MAG: C45 family peptidase [Hyphomonadaceae bacterium]
MERWGDTLERGYGVDRPSLRVTLLRTHAYRATLERAASTSWRKSAALRKANAPLDALLAFQHVNEEFELGPRFARIALVGEACSTIALAPTEARPALIAQNLDLAQFLDGFQIMLRGPCNDGDGEVLALSVPGMISLNGMNSYGLAVCDNTLTQLRTDPAGVPIFALYRLLLEARTLADARALVERTPHAVGLNWVMGDPSGVAMIERSGRESVFFGPNADGAPAFHTNHPLVCREIGAKPRSGPRAAPICATPHCISACMAAPPIALTSKI